MRLKLTGTQRDYLRILGHDLQTTFSVGAGGLTNSTLKRLDQALHTQELVKIRVPFGNRQRREEILETLAPISNAYLVQRARNVAVLYRPARQPIICLPSSESERGN